ncbi:MAG: MFS transporter [Dehalococcoidaceae bacterium]|nr:MFS transporter [Dehalococcoidaceae bacterium]
MKSNTSSLTIKQKLGYGLGSSASNFIWQMVSFYLLFFYTDVLGIPAAAAGTLLLLARVFDGLNDLVEGHIVDLTRSRWGRFRPYLLFGALPIALLLVLTFYTPDIGVNAKIAYAAVTYVLLGIAYSFMTIPHSALMASMTQDANERSSLASFLMASVYATILVVAATTMPLVNLFPTRQIGFTATAAIFGILAIILYLVCFASTREIKPAPVRKNSIKAEFKLLVHNKYLLIMLAALLFTQAANDMRTSSAIYFFKYNIGNKAFYPLFMAGMIICMVAGALVAPCLARKLASKRNLFIAGTLIVVLSSTAVIFVPYSNILLITAGLGVSSVGIGITYVMIRSMLADTVEYGEWKTGIRGEGIIFSTFGITNKLGYALGGSLSAFLLAGAGYIPDAVQNKQVLDVILYMLTLFPVIAGVLAIAIMLFYKLDNRRYDDVLKDLKERNG